MSETPPPATGAAIARQVVAGHAVGPAAHTPTGACDVCHDGFSEGQPVVVIVERPADAPAWDVTCVACVDCRTDYVPTLGVEGARLAGWLATRSQPTVRRWRYAVVEPELERYSPPAEGAPP